MTDEELVEEYVSSSTSDRGYYYEGLKEGFFAGLKAGRPKWHKVVDGDLPKHEVNVLVLHSVQCIDIAHYNYDYKEWHFADSIVRDVTAWCEIPKYMGE